MGTDRRRTGMAVGWRRVRVLIAVPFGEQRGGAEKMLMHLLRANHVAPGVEYGVAFLADGPMVDEVASLGYRVWRLPAGRMREFGQLLATVVALRGLLRSWRPAAAMSWMAKAHLYLGPAATLAAVPATWWQHGIPYNGWLDRVATAVPARTVFCCSQASSAGQTSLRPSRPTAVVYPAVDLEAMAAERAVDPGHARRCLGLAPGGPLVGILARLQRWKGLHVFLEAAAQVARQDDGVRFVVVGGEHFSEPELPGELRVHAQRLGVADRVRFAGHQENPERWMSAMDVVVHASVGPEPFGMVVAEAMALGKPVVAPSLGGPLEIVTDGVDGLLVPPGDAAALAAAVLRLLRDEDLRGRLSAAAPAAVARFGAPRLALEVAAHLEAVARSQRPAV